jgi:dihydroorotate dehydrogenase electron transfer subunit
MSHSLPAAHYADHAVQRTVRVVENVPLARGISRVRVRCPEIARAILPGQFVMLRLADYNDPLIGRPLALYDTVMSESGEPDGLDLVYFVKGKFTRRLAEFTSGQRLDIWGPLGNGFPPQATRHLIMVAGGIGQTPFLALAHEALGGRRYGDPPRTVTVCPRVTLCYGTRTSDLFAGLEDFRRLGVETRLATEDGSCGHHGLVTEVLDQALAESDPSRRLVCCGPDPMMKAVAEVAAKTQTPCLVSLETPMACGIGICFTCVVRVRQPSGGWDYRRACVEGPVFDAASIEW